MEAVLAIRVAPQMTVISWGGGGVTFCMFIMHVAHLMHERGAEIQRLSEIWAKFLNHAVAYQPPASLLCSASRHDYPSCARVVVNCF